MDGLDSSQLIIWMIAACVVIMLALIFIKQIKAVAKVLIQGAAGIAVVYVLNFVTASMGLTVGINIVTAAVIGILGIPGLATLYLAQIFL